MAEVAAAYGVETTAEVAVGATVAIARSTMPLKAQWTRLKGPQLSRSSHSLSIIKSKAYIFGGEEKPREPVDNHIHVFTLPLSEHDEVDYQIIPARASAENGELPSPRVGHVASTVDDRIYIFGGRGGKDMKPLEESGRVWVFDSKLNVWSFLDPARGSPSPESRSYHASTSTEHPLNQRELQNAPPAGSVASAFTKDNPNETKDYTENPLGETGSGADDHGTLFIHGGCPGSGRTADIWAFDVASRVWSQYPDVPGPPRGGPSLTLTRERLYRFGGFDGEKELGGSIQYLRLTRSMFNDKGGKGDLAVSPLDGQWANVEPPTGTLTPGDRSVAGLQPVTTGQGRHYLLLFLGERDPSALGHESAGKFWDDVWSFQLRPEGMTAASFKDATRQLIGAKSAEGTWARVDVPESSKEGSVEHPGPRGWFASSNGQDLEAGGVVLHGGVREDNSRAGDMWKLTIDS
ncbi:hypothetical protein P7C71_g2155, partial [Lecanoromycetidae sp. Uapishka_2]